MIDVGQAEVVSECADLCVVLCQHGQAHGRCEHEGKKRNSDFPWKILLF
jgi:hypothetical protein